MADWAIWMLLAGALVAAELFSGTFYLLMLGIGMAAGSVAAYAGLQVEWQLLAAAVVGIVATGLMRRSRLGRRRPVAAERDPNVSMDIGQLLHVDGWRGVDGHYSARVPYRGALWDVDLETSGVDASGPVPASAPVSGAYLISEIRGSRLIVRAAGR